MINWKECVNKSAGNERVEDIQSYLTIDMPVYKAPIDEFYVEVKKIVMYSSNIQMLEENEFLGSLLYVGIISKTENYIREILTECIKICPICKRETANRSVSFGSMMWQRSGEFEKGIFENISFSDSSAIKKELKNCLKVDINKNELLSELLDEFDKLCQMRHAIVHSSRVLAGKNAIQLNIPPSVDKLSIRVGYAQLQECASICTACVMTFNLKLFEVMGHRWAIDWRRLTDFWDEEKEDEYFSKIWDIFSSVIDRNEADLAEMTKAECINAIKIEYQLD